MTNKIQLFLICLFLVCSTLLRRILRPSSGAHNCIYGFNYCLPILLLAGIVNEMALSSITEAVNTVMCSS
jgi:hypothetical protein